MKFKKNRVYDALFLSDIHYLVDKKRKKTGHNELFSTLNFFYKKNIFFRELILVGDIIENWYFNASKKMKTRQKKLDKFFQLMERIVTNDGKKIYLIGNHDTTKYDLTLPDRVEQYLKKRKWMIMERYETEEMVVAHGHQGQYSRIRWQFNIIFLRILYKFPFLWNIMERLYSRYLDFDKNLPIERMINYYSKLTKRLNQRDRVLIVGHTHKFAALNQLRVINTGDWLETKSLVVKNRKKYTGFRYLNSEQKRVNFIKDFEVES